MGCLHKRVVLGLLRSVVLHSLRLLLAGGLLQRGLEVGDERNDVVVGAAESGHIGVP